MNNIRIGAATLNQTPLDWSGNKRNITDALQRARKQGIQVLCLPELCISGYGCEDAFLSGAVQEMALTVLHEILPSTKGMIVTLGLPLLHKNALFNVACLVVDGRIMGFAAKQFLAGDGLHYEPRWFNPWPQQIRDTINIKGRNYPMGSVVFDCGGLKIGFEICEDAWVAKRPGSALALSGVDLILNPSASHFSFSKYEVRKRLVTEGSRAFGVGYIYTNLVGNEAGRAIYDGGVLIAAGGTLIAAGPRFTFTPYEVTSAVLDLNALRMNRARTRSFQPKLKRDSNASAHISCAFLFPDIEPEASGLGIEALEALEALEAWERSDAIKEEEFTRAVTLGLFDYMRKSRSNGFVVSLSGGADSAATACLVALAIEAAELKLGQQAFHQTLSYIEGLGDCRTTSEKVARLLHCVYQGSENSSAATRESARKLAKGLGATFSYFEIDQLVSGYVSGMENLLGRKLSWETDDIALQNIQARVRAPSVWMLANIKNALLLATSNRSEAAVGYATMDGDTCGGLSPIAGIDKAFLLQWLRWLETKGPHGLHPVTELSEVNALIPTAELRPPDAAQTDETDLMPYEVLDAVERAVIRDKKSPIETFRLLRQKLPSYDQDQIRIWIERFFTLWCRNQWKRERYAPSFHLDDENLDPKTWCRFPILSGGFKRELAELGNFKN